MSVTGHNFGDTEDPPSAGTLGATSIRDVGRIAGVSYQTVSRVLNDHPHVRAQTRARVQDVIDSLGFRPSRAARDLAVGAAAQVTVLTTNTDLYGYASTIAGIEEAARAQGVRVAIRVLQADDPDDIRSAIEHVRDPRSGAVIVVAYDSVGYQVLQGMPAEVRMAAVCESVLGHEATPQARERWAWFDEVSVAREATEHLLGLGHRTVHHIPIPSSTGVGARQQGWELALTQAGAPVPPVPVFDEWTVAAAHRYATGLLADRSVTAVLCGNDDQAVGVMRAAHDLGLRVGRDVSVIGFDDIPSAEFLVPSLTTVRLDFKALGRRAFELLGIGDPSDATSATDIPAPTLQIRESSAKAIRRRR